MNIQSRNCEETLFACLYACATVTEEVNNIDWPASTAAGSLLKHLQDQRSGTENRLFLDVLGYLDVSDQILDMADFYDANMVKSKLAHAQLNQACI